MASADQLIAALEGLDANSFANEAERVRARDALFSSLRKVQVPWDVDWEHNWVNPTTHACVKTLSDAGVFTKWAEAGYGNKTCAELAGLTGADELLIKRMMHQISGQCLVEEVGEDTFAPTPWSKTMAEDQAFANCYGRFCRDINGSLARDLPYYLRSVGYKNPTDPNNCAWQYGHGPEANFFQFIGSNPEVRRDFNDAMESHSKHNLTSWPEVYPTQKLLDEAKEDRPLVVDVGGGKGHDLEKFRLRHPDIPAGSLVLEDLGDILTDVKTSDKVKVQPHDFFTPQPVQGARAYFMHNVLHDWSDAQAKSILVHIAAAMEPGYSRLLIHESLVSNRKPLARVTTSDVIMLGLLAAKERTETEWRTLLESAGLKVLNIWRPPQSVESVIEAERV